MGIAVASFAAAIFLLSSGGKEPVPELEPLLEECPSAYVGFGHSVNWYSGKNRLQVKADLACGAKYGEMYELKNVSLEIQSGKNVFTRIHSPRATYWPKRQVFLISEIKGDRGCIHGPDPVLVDFKSGELRAPGIRKMLNTKQLLSCKRRVD